MSILRFFFGTPQRLLATVVAMMLVVGLVQPQIVETAVYNLLLALHRAVSPFAEGLVSIALWAALAIWVLGKAWRSTFPTKKGGK